MLTPRDVELVQYSFAKVAPSAEPVAALFYERLFTLDPALRPLFTSDLHEQGRKLMRMLGMVVNGLDALDRLVPVAADLSKRHVSYGVQPAHYATVGEALLWTLKEGLADDFTEDVRMAWTKTYAVVSQVMIDAAYPKSQASAV